LLLHHKCHKVSSSPKRCSHCAEELSRVSWPKGDFNGDGKLDVLLAGRNASAKPVLVVFLGNGTGGFGVPIVTTIAGVNKAQIALAGDLHGDGIQDAVVTGTDTLTGVTEFGVMLADGTGKFKTARIHPGFSCRTYDTG
jgi:hypothetical protein